MHVQNIQFTSKVRLNNNFTKNQNPKNTDNNSYVTELPKFAYQDYNISFGERLHRTPENFYAQPFNKKNMPESMKAYLYSDFEKNSKMAPALIMKLTYEDLNDINSLDLIKRHYAEEPLFKNLTDVPKRKVRKGVVSDIEAMKDEFATIPLFKDGKSNFGVYVLRKIYFDGKSLDEIRKDFKKDLSSEYEGLIGTDIQYDDIYAYGISFPKTPFWKSFLATREDFPYVYKPRKSTGEHAGSSVERSLSTILSGEYSSTPRKPKFTVKDADEGRRFGEALIKGHGNAKSTANSLRHKGVSDNEKVSFITKYLSEIMSVSLEKIHASDEMHSFFESYDNLPKRQREKLEAYWQQNPMMRDLQALAISDTIKLFFLTYGPDGNNPEFQELLEYARNIKPNREAKLREHDLIQLEYDELAKILAEQDAANEIEQPPVVTPVPKQMSKEEMENLIRLEALKNGAEVIKVKNDDGTEIDYLVNIDEEYDKYMKSLLSLVPTPALNKFIRFCKKSEYSNPEYRKCMALQSYLSADVLERMGLDRQRCNVTASTLNSMYYKKYPALVAAAQQAMAEMLINKTGNENLFLLRLIASMQQHYATEELDISEWTPEEQAIVNQKFKDYSTPVKNTQEIKKICQMIPQLVSSVDPESPRWVKLGELDDVDALLAANLRKHPQLMDDLTKTLRNKCFIENSDGSVKALLRDDVSPEIKMAKARLILRDFIGRVPTMAIPYLACDISNIDKYISDPRTKFSLMKCNTTIGLQ